MILGVTGGIAAGKSSVTALFRELGAEVISADDLAREVVGPGSPVLERIVKHFGPQVLRPDGGLDRQALAARIFGDSDARGDLNRIIHPAIAQLAQARLGEAAARSSVVVYEAPLLFEAGAEGRVDAVLVVTVSQSVQLRRLMERDGLSENEARARIEAQMSQDEKVARADFVIDNSGEKQATEEAVRRLYAELCRQER